MTTSTRKSSAEDTLEGNFHQAKGALKETLGNIANDRELKADGKAENKAGKIQQRLGDAKEKVAQLKGQFKEAKKAKH